MNPAEFRQILLQTIADQRVSRTESRALSAKLADLSPDVQLLGAYRRSAFEVAQQALADGAPSAAILTWLEDVIAAVASAARSDAPASPAEACFSPGDACVRRIRGLFQQAKSTVDVCVFTITDDRISDEILAAHERGIVLRVLTDNEKAFDVGSDAARLSAAGIATRVDATEYHMHHKFAIFDRRTLVTGSYNWTRSAAEYNEENMLSTSEPAVLAQFQQVFERLWTRCAEFRSPK
ncbi:MAG: phospholipase D-like domain-containing protein [Planctomycetaceae bacterium]